MGSKPAEKPSARTPRMAMLKVDDGGTIEVVDRAEKSKATGQVSDSGVVYTDEMPSLEGLLNKYNVQYAILDKMPDPILEGSSHQRTESSTDLSKNFGRAVVLGGFPAMFLTAGMVMMVGAIVGRSSVTNPYMGLFLILVGLTLGATSWAALREARRRRT